MAAEDDGFSVDAAGIGPGTRLGPYEIERPLGAGGMGHVFRARDTRLGRTVAIKVSLKQFSGRFEREAHFADDLCPHVQHVARVVPRSGQEIGPRFRVLGSFSSDGHQRIIRPRPDDCIPGIASFARDSHIDASE